MKNLNSNRPLSGADLESRKDSISRRLNKTKQRARSKAFEVHNYSFINFKPLQLTIHSEDITTAQQNSVIRTYYEMT